MAHIDLGFKSAVLAGTASTILATVLIWAFGYLSSVWFWLKSFCIRLWSLINYPISIPAGVVVFLFLLFWVLANRKASTAALVETSQPRAATRIEPVAIKSAPAYPQ